MDQPTVLEFRNGLGRSGAIREGTSRTQGIGGIERGIILDGSAQGRARSSKGVNRRRTGSCRAQRVRARSDEWRSAWVGRGFRGGGQEERRLGRRPNPHDVDHAMRVDVDQEQGLVVELTDRAVVCGFAPEVA